jgi:hypothetical protein
MDAAPQYLPWLKGKYDVSPGLRPLGTDFGNGEWDQKVFQLAPDASRLIDAKRIALRERRGKYARAFRLSQTVKRAAIETIATRLATEYPDRFQIDHEGTELVLCSGDIRWTLTADRREDSAPALDLLARLVPEDFAVVATEGDIDWLAYGHICAPSHWGIEDKIGRSFAEVHGPVPGMVRPAPMPQRMVEAMTTRGPWVRFVWAIESDDRPNHHPDAPPDQDPTEWWGRQFTAARQFWVRVERQCTIPMPEVGAAIFTIRLSWVPGSLVVANEAWRQPLRDALEGMTDDEREYKGLSQDWGGLMALLS